MPQASILINGVAGPKLDALTGVAVALSNDNSGGETTYLWELLDAPANFGGSITNPTAHTASLTPVEEGTYLIKLTVNGSLEDQTLVSIPAFLTGLRNPAAGERNTMAGSKGWASALKEYFVSLEGALKGLGTQLAYCDVGGGSPIAARTVVILSQSLGIPFYAPQSPLASGYDLAAYALASAQRQLGSSTPTPPYQLGVVLGTVRGSTPAITQDVVRVQTRGLCVTSGWGALSPSFGAPVYADDTGMMSLTPGSASLQIGYVVAGDSYDALAVWLQTEPIVLTNDSRLTDSRTPTGTATAAVNPAVIPLTPSGTTYNTNAALGNHFTLTLGSSASYTLAAPTNPTDGQCCTWVVRQNSAGSKTLTLDSVFIKAGGGSYTITSTANAIDVLTAIYDSTANKWLLNVGQDYKA